jgi:hypothetical protein
MKLIKIRGIHFELGEGEKVRIHYTPIPAFIQPDTCGPWVSLVDLARASERLLRSRLRVQKRQEAKQKAQAKRKPKPALKGKGIIRREPIVLQQLDMSLSRYG